MKFFGIGVAKRAGLSDKIQYGTVFYKIMNVRRTDKEYRGLQHLPSTYNVREAGQESEGALLCPLE